MRIGTIVQARTGSTRLPGKVLRPVIGERTVLHCVLERVLRSRLVTTVILATTTSPADDEIVRLANLFSISVYRGSEEDVLSRYLVAMDTFELQAVVRITADCPLIEPTVIDEVVQLYLQSPCDYAFVESYPRGSGDAEVITYSALQCANWRAGSEFYYREHVVTFLLEHPTNFRLVIRSAPSRYIRPDLRLCVDEAADLEVVRHIYKHFAPRTDFSLEEVIAFLDAHPEIASLNRHIQQKTH